MDIRSSARFGIARRQNEVGDQARGRARLEMEGTAVAPCDFIHDRQSEATAVGSGPAAPKTLDGLTTFSRAQPGAFVDNAKSDRAAIVPLDAQPHPGVRGRIAQRVVE